MEIRIDIKKEELSEADKTLIKECLSIVSDEELNAALSRLCKAAFMEYIKMFKEKGLPTRADEVLQERLFFLLSFYFQNRLPEESEISTIFQLTPSQSRTVLRNTKSRYRTKITHFIKETLRNVLSTATKGDEGYEFICMSTTVIEELNSIINQKGPTLEPIQKVRSLACKYTCALDTYELLQSELRQ